MLTCEATRAASSVSASGNPGPHAITLHCVGWRPPWIGHTLTLAEGWLKSRSERSKRLERDANRADRWRSGRKKPTEIAVRASDRWFKTGAAWRGTRNARRSLCPQWCKTWSSWALARAKHRGNQAWDWFRFTKSERGEGRGGAVAGIGNDPEAVHAVNFTS